MPKTKYSEELKLEIIHYVMEGHSMNEAAKKFAVEKQNIQKWRDAYEQQGVKGILIRQNHHHKYTGDFKIHVIEYKHQNQLSARQTAAHFNIATWQSVINWERKYNQEGPDSLLIENRGKASYRTGTMKGKKPSFSQEKKWESLEEENRRLRMENEYLKKLNALVQEKEKSQKKKKPL